MTGLLKITDDWCNGLDNGQMMGSISDLKKAFEAVDHDLLCKNCITVFSRERCLGFNLISIKGGRTAELGRGVDSLTGKIEVGVPQR